ncbi:hypothetical protein EG329_010734 [Mollisiaceae sp. DMI_Dod_QoI]|nr:hypothetical protein EG329_010734 [Helotiales sp. DMI_Dod_QoI]
MTITALPEATTRLLGSSQALTTPTSLVKELIDNALDAKATAIDILISTNTVDKIEIRDNGHGIPQEDLDALGRHGHTSKLRSFDELTSIGGLSLGFRGEALASAVQLGDVSVTTKTEGEPAATAVKLKPLGGVACQTHTSNPIGTTITVTNFLSKLPVRKQNALKEASKMLSKLKDLLQAYCLARPRVKFSLKVLKSSKGSWSYAPRPNDGIKEAVSLVIGRDTASQCMEKSLMFSERGLQADAAIEDGNDTTDINISEFSFENGVNLFIINMFLPKPDADVSKIGHGQYISIDSRPVSHEKGTMRKIVTLFRSYLKDSLTDTSEKLKNPFLWMDIKCPVASYDANVEPAKDDVLFCNEALVLKSIEKAFKDIYSKREDPFDAVALQKPASHVENFDLLKARVPMARQTDIPNPSLTSTSSSELPLEISATTSRAVVTHAHGVSEPTDTIEGDKEPVGAQKRKWNIDMSEDYNEEIEGIYKHNSRSQLSDTPQISGLASQTSHGNSLNPWVIAKITAPIQRTQGIFLNNANRSVQSSRTFLPTPQQSSDPLSADLDVLQPGMDVPRPGQTFQAEDIASLTLPPVQKPSHEQQGSRQPSLELDNELTLGYGSKNFRRHNEFVSARHVAIEPMMPEEPSGSTPSKSWKSVNKPFVAPMRVGNGRPSKDGLRQTKLNVGTLSSRMVENVQQLPEASDLAWAMDFEQRKEDATRQRRDEIRIARMEARPRQSRENTKESHQSEDVENSPHKNRYNAAIASLEAEYERSRSFPTKEPFKTSLPDGDPRAYLIKRQRSISIRQGERPKLSRAKSMRLPLERIPENEKLHSLLLPVSADIPMLQKTILILKQSDLYIQHGVLGGGLVLHGHEKEEITSKVQATFEKWKGWKGNMFGEHVDGGGVQVPIFS